MRKDMAKVLVERPRQIGHYPQNFPRRKAIFKNELNRVARGLIYEDDETGEEYQDDNKLDAFEPIKSRYDARKSLNENLAPLRRFLENRLGARWDDVYSEIRENLKVDSAVQLHVIQHLRHYVVVATELGDDGHVYKSTTYGYGFSEPLDVPNRRGKYTFYVDPVTKTLARAPLRNKSSFGKPKTLKFAPAWNLQFRFIDGKWVAIELKRFQYGNPNEKPNEHFFVPAKNGILKTIPVDGYNYPDALFPEGLDGRKRDDEYGSFGLYAFKIRPLGYREEVLLEKLLKEKK